MMDEKEVKNLICPAVLVHLDGEITSMGGQKATGVVGLRVQHVHGKDFELGVWTKPLPLGPPEIVCTINEVVQAGARPVTADEERSWVARAAS